MRTRIEEKLVRDRVGSSVIWERLGVELKGEAELRCFSHLVGMRPGFLYEMFEARPTSFLL